MQRDSAETCPISLAADPILSGPGTVEPNCTSSASGTTCQFPDAANPNVPNGEHVFTFTCSSIEWAAGAEEPTITYDSDSISVVIDNTPPVITITSAPPDGSTLPYASFRIEGTIDDVSPLVSLQTASGIQISTNGSQWFVDFATGSGVGYPPNSVAIPLSGPLEFSVKAIDIVGNLIAVSTESQLAGTSNWVADPTMAQSWNFDGVPPVVEFSSDSIGSLTQIASIRGTASDNYKLDKIQLTIMEDSTGRYWNGNQFTAGITTITVPLVQVESSDWEYSGLNSDEMVAESSYTVRVRALDALQGATVIEASLTLAAAFLGEGIVSDLFDGALVQFIAPRSYLNLGENFPICVKYLSPEIRDAVRFGESPKQSVVVSPKSQPDPTCPAPTERLSILSIIPTLPNQNPPIVTGCDDQTEIRAFIGSQIVGRLKLDIVTPKKVTSEIESFRNDYGNQITGIPRLQNCRFNDPYCIGYEHRIFIERGSDPNNRLLVLPTGAWIRETISVTSLPHYECMPAAVTTAEGHVSQASPGRYFLFDFNGYNTNVRSLPFPPNCTDLSTQEIIVGKCKLGPINLAQRIRTINGVRKMFMSRSDHNNSSTPSYPTP